MSLVWLALLGLAAGVAFLVRRHAPATVTAELLPPTGEPIQLEPGVVPAPAERIRLKYRDSDGIVTERIVSPRAISGSRARDGRVRPERIEAFCELRRDSRTFSLERIKAATIVVSNEPVEDLYDYFGSAQPGGSPPRLRARTSFVSLQPRPPPLPAFSQTVSPVPLLLRYRDAQGVVADRTVIPRKLEGRSNPDGTLQQPRLKALCQTERALRTFRLERIEWAAVAETGEVIDRLEQHLRDGNARPD